MKSNKGFTLIELLAVIVILAIIALITVPVVINIINNARKGAAEDSAYGVIEAGRLYYVSNQANEEFDGDTVTFTCGTNGKCLNGEEELSLSGTHPTGGSIIITGEGVQLSKLKYGNYECSTTTGGKVNCTTD